MGYDHYSQRQPRSGFSTERLTWATQRLILANIVVFAVQLLIDIPWGGAPGAAAGGAFVREWLMFEPSRFLHSLHGFIWQPFTYMFLHANLSHLFRNMLWLFFFGSMVERLLGTRQFIRFYVLCGAVGVLATYIPWAYYTRKLGMAPGVPVVGASGAVMGVLIAAAMANPDRQFFLFPLPIPINMRAFVLIIVALNVVSALSGGTTSVATHFGGLIVGFLYMWLTPRLRNWMRPIRREKDTSGNASDPVGDAVDKIFDFEEERRRRGR